MENNCRLKVAISGIGKHAKRAHLNILHEIDECNIEAVYDLDKNKCENFCNSNGYNLSIIKEDFEQLLSSGCNTLFCFSPDIYHLEQAKKAIDSGLNVFVEKPCAIDRNGKKILESLIVEAKNKNLLLASCYPRRFDDPFIKLKEVYESGWLKDKIGEILHFNFSFWYHKITDEWKADRSLLLDHFSQEIDALSWAFGLTGNFRASVALDKPTIYLAHGSVGNKLSFSFMGSRSLEEVVYREAFRVDGTKGSFFVDIENGKAMLLPTREEFSWPKTDFEKAFEKINRSFIGSCLGKNELYMSVNDLYRCESMACDLTELGMASY